MALTETLIYAEEVLAFWQQYAYANLSSTFAAPASLTKLKSSLEDRSNSLKGQADTVLEKNFGVKTVGELQERINRLNQNSGLINFTNNAITNAFKDRGESAGTDKEVTEALINYLNSNKAQSIINDFIDKSGIATRVKDVSMQKLAAALNIAVATARAERKAAGQAVDELNPKVIEERIKEMIKTKKGTINFGGYKNDVVLFLREQGIAIGDNQITSTWAVSAPNVAVLNVDSFYPYFNLLPNQEKIARDISSGEGKIAWENFKDHLLNLANLGDKRKRGEEILNQLGPGDFIKKDINGIVGILGEVQAAFMLAYLSNNTLVHITPNLQSKYGGQLRADLILNSDIGIQVKNYKSYSGSDNIGFQLRDELPLSTVLERAVVGNKDSVGDFLAVQYYNEPTDKKSKYFQYYKQATGTYRLGLNAFFAANLDAFIQIEDSLKEQDKQNIIAESFNNLFFIFGGTQIVPTWAILSHLASQIGNLIEAIDQIIDQNSEREFRLNGLGGMNLRLSLSANTSYTGPVWKPQVQAKEQRLSIQGDIWPKIKVATNLNIYMGDILNVLKTYA